MEGSSNWKPNEQGGDSLANNANDWRSQHGPDLRKRVVSTIAEKLKKLCPNNDQNDINNTAIKLEDRIYGTATDKDDYFHTLVQKVIAFTEQKARNAQFNNVQSRFSVNRTDSSNPAAQFLNQCQSLPTSLPYTHTSTSQKWLPQNIQSNLNTPGSSGLPTQVPITVSAAQNLNIQMGEGVHSNLLPGSQRQIQGRQQLLPQQPQDSNYMFQHQMDQQPLKEKIRHGNLRPPYMQQQAQQQHHQPIQQQLPHQTSLSTIHKSFPQSSALSSLPSSGQQNSQFLPTHQFSTQRAHPSHQQQMAVPSKEQKQQEQDQLISQLMNGPRTQQNHLPSRQNNGEQQGAFRVSSSQIASFQAMAQENNNLQNMHQEQRLSSHGNNASALPSQQQQNMPGGQSGNFNVPGSSLFCSQGQEVGQSQPVMLQQYQLQHPVQQQQPQNRSLQQHLDDTQRFQAAGSLRQTKNVADQQNQPYQLQRAPPENPSTSHDSTGKTANGSGGDWQEETYQKIKALREKHIPVLITMLQKVTYKLRQLDSTQEKTQSESTEKLRGGKSMLEQVIVFLNVRKSRITEKHRDRFSQYEEQVLRLTRYQPGARRPMQQQQGQFPPSHIHQTALQSQSGQVHVPQPLDNDQMNSQLMSSNQNGASSSVSGLTASQTSMLSMQTRPKMEPKDNNNNMASSGNVMLPSLKQHSNISPVQSSSMLQQKQFHRLPMQQQQQPPTNQQLQMAKNEMSDMRMKQGVNIKAGLLQQHLSSNQRQLPKPLASPARMSKFSPSASSPQIQYHSSPQVDKQIIPTTFGKTGTSSQSGGSPFVAPSPVTSFAPSPTPGGPERPISVESPVLHAYQSQTAAQEHSQFTLPPEPIAERPIDRLIKAFQSSSPKSLAESVSEMSSAISLADRIAGSFHSCGGSRARLAEDLSARTKFRLQQGETNPTKRFKRSISTLPLAIASQTDFSSLESEVDSTASSGSKANNIEPGCALLQEIKEINGRLVETVVNICSEVPSGTVVTCSYAPVALSDTFEAHYKSGHISQIQPLRLLVPENYPYSPILLEKTSFDASVHNYDDLSARTRLRLSLTMKKLSEPMSLKEIAQAWDDCARATMAEYAERHGGGTFSSKYGHWETVLRAS